MSSNVEVGAWSPGYRDCEIVLSKEEQVVTVRLTPDQFEKLRRDLNEVAHYAWKVCKEGPLDRKHPAKEAPVS